MQILLNDMLCKKPKGPEMFDLGQRGLFLRTGATKQTWGMVYPIPGTKPIRRTRLGLGTYPSTSLEDARKRCEAKWKLIEAGKDPSLDHTLDSDFITMAQLIDLYCAERVAGPKSIKTGYRVKAAFALHVTPVIGGVLVKDFRYKHWKMVLKPIMAAGTHEAALKLYQYVRGLAAFGVREGHIESGIDPLACAETPCEKGEAKTRFLSPAEVATIWHRADDALYDADIVPDVLRLILATGQRPGECAGVRREDVDLQHRIWTIPETKNGHMHKVTLNDLAVEILSRRMRLTNGDFLFPYGDRAITNIEISHAVYWAFGGKKAGIPQQDRFTPLGVAKFTPHDLRRTAATYMNAAQEPEPGQPRGIQASILDIGYLLNHRSTTHKSVTAKVYIQNHYLVEKRRVTNPWGEFLAAMIGDNEMREAA